MDKITIIIPFCNDFDQRIPLQLKYWKTYPDEFWERLNVLLVDDCSKIPIITKLPSDLPNFNFKLVRIKTDLLWNLPGAYNLGIHLAPTEWVWCMDSDHVVSIDEMEKLLKLSLDPNKIYMFHRNRHSQLERINSVHSLASGCWLHTKFQWKELNGLNEDMTGARSGGYGAWDWDYTYRLTSVFKRNPRPRIFIEEYMPDVLGESTSSGKVSTRVHLRNRKIYRKIQAEHKLVLDQKILRFEWEEVLTKCRSNL